MVLSRSTWVWLWAGLGLAALSQYLQWVSGIYSFVAPHSVAAGGSGGGRDPWEGQQQQVWQRAIGGSRLADGKVLQVSGHNRCGGLS
jgi:hypothetical protein